MERIHAREIVNMTLEQARSLPIKHIVIFDDNEEDMCWQNESIFTFLFWHLFKPYPNTRILKKHHLHNVLDGGTLDTGTPMKICTRILKSVVMEEGLFLPIQKEPILAEIYKAISTAQGVLSVIAERDVVGLDILDFVQIARDPRIIALREEAQANPKRIKFVYEDAERLILNSPEFAENGLAKAMRSKMAKAGQVVQCVVFRGFGTEVDGTIFPTPIWGNYTQGNLKFYDFMADSRLAAKSHFYADTALKDSEYSARRFQLFAMPLERINWHDCGTTKMTPWMVNSPTFDDDNTVTYPGDLTFMVGKYYRETKNPDEPLKIIQGNEKHLFGKMIYLRTIMNCKTPDPHECCHVCLGELSQNISRFSNLGHLGAVTSTKEFTQNILSIKHVNTSSMVLKVMLGDHERTVLNTGKDGSAYYINAGLKELEPTLTIARDNLPGLIDLIDIDDLSQIGLPRISSVEAISIGVKMSKRDTGRRTIVADTTQRSKASILTREFLTYIKKAGWTTDVQNNFVFDLKDWDFDKPLLALGNKEESYVDLANQANKIVQGNQKLIKLRHRENAADLLLQELFELVNSKLRVNIVSFEIIIYPLMVKSKSSYELARGSEEQVLGVAELITKYRSGGAALAYEDQGDFLTNPANFFRGKRPDNPMDVFIAPREVVAAEERRKALREQNP